MVNGEKLTDAIRYEKLDVMKKDLSLYIEKNISKIDSNLPVFFGHVISALDQSFPDLDDAAYDEYIDDIAYRILETSPKASDIEFIERLNDNANRWKRKKGGKASLNILAGLKLMSVGKYRESISYLSNFWKYDARIGFYIAYCYYQLSKQEPAVATVNGKRPPSEMELYAREQLLDLARVKPPIYRLRQLDLRDSPLMKEAFWTMIARSLEWLPNERWFAMVGLEKAKKDRNEDMRRKLIKFATEKFFNDMFFLQEHFALRLEDRDGVGAAGVVRQMRQQYPAMLEPVYYGIKLSLLSASASSYTAYRDLALEKDMPLHLVHLLDFGFFVLKNEKREAMAHLKEMKGRFKSLTYYLVPLEYLAREILSGDEEQARKAKKAFFESIDSYAMELVREKE
ncbi:MAG TPA: hypothetical protein ENN85_04530 [Methanoculleus sp.]|nr:hypothetical protein [Methanoculleus sp.]